MHRGVRQRDPARIVEEMVWAKKHFGHDTFFFQDDASFLVREQLEGFLDEIEKCGEKLYWYYETREDVFLSFRDLWQRMKRNGLFKIVFGLESPDPKQRERFGKRGYDASTVESMMHTLEKELDILVSVYLIFGVPEDTQAAVSVRGDVAAALGLKPEAVVVSQPYLGAGLGHKVETKAAVEAVRLSQAAGRPVHLVWSRDEDFRNSFVRPPTHHILRASLAADGRIEALVHEQASGKVALPFLPAIAGAVLGHDFGAWRGARIGYSIPNRETIAWVAELPFLTGWWRGLGLLPNTFAVECFMDEVAIAAGLDPIELRLRHLPEGRLGERLAGVLRAAADRAGWNTPAPAGRARGVACCADYGTLVAAVAEISVAGGQVRVHKVTVAVDPGVIVNPDGVAAQVEGNAIMGVSSALLEEVTVADGVLSPANFGAYRILNMAAAPEVEVVLLQGDDQPHGIGEPPIGPVAPAVANAVHALTGRRLRRLPLQLETPA